MIIKRALFLIFTLFLSQTTLAKSYKTKARTVDKFYIYNLFTEVFGKHNKKLLFEKVIRRNDLYGGGCLPYNSIQMKANFTINDPNIKDTCNKNISEIGEPNFREIGTIRQTHTENLCRELTSNQKNIEHFLSHIELDSNSARNTENINKVVTLFFYKKKEINKYVAALEKKKNLSWSKTAFVLCSSPQWQIL
jgi:hypothetical protein